MPLFKYAPPQRVDILQGLRLRFTPPIEFNDPFECLPDLKLLESPEFAADVRSKVLQEIALNPSQKLNLTNAPAIFDARYRDDLENRKRRMLGEMRNAALMPLRILSLSRVPPTSRKSVPMWAHYAKGSSTSSQGHDGIAIEFDENHPWIKAHAFVRGRPYDSGNVEYGTARVGWEKFTPSGKFHFVKAVSWQHEEEFRLVRFAGDPELDQRCLVSFPADLVVSVTLGMYASRDTYDSVRRTLNAHERLSKVVLRQVRPHPDEFEFELIELPK